MSLQGTIEYAKMQVEKYQNHLESRIIARFDKAESKKDLTDMAACALVMDEFERTSGTSLVQVIFSHIPPFASCISTILLPISAA